MRRIMTRFVVLWQRLLTHTGTATESDVNAAAGSGYARPKRRCTILVLVAPIVL